MPDVVTYVLEYQAAVGIGAGKAHHSHERRKVQMQTAMDRFDEAMRQLKSAQTEEAPLWEAVEAGVGVGVAPFSRTVEDLILKSR